MLDMAVSYLPEMVGKDEKILWKGKPNKKCFVLEAVFNPMMPFALIWALFDFTFIGAFLGGFSQIPTNELEIPFVGIGLALVGFFALHLMPVWIYLGGVIFSFLKYKHTEYIITDKAVYVSGGLFAQTCEMKSFAELSHVNMHRGIIDQLVGVGDVVLTSNQDGYNTNNNLFRGITIADIPDFQDVYNLVKKLQIDIYTDTMYPNDLRPAENHGYNTKYINRDDEK